jgi:hypothetical protein
MKKQVIIRKQPTYEPGRQWLWTVEALDGYVYDAFSLKCDAVAFCKRSEFSIKKT